MDLEDLCGAIYKRLRANPQDITRVHMAVLAAVDQAIKDANERAGAASFAMTAALVLADPKRLSAEARDALCTVVIKAINPEIAAPIERDFLKKVGA